LPKGQAQLCDGTLPIALRLFCAPMTHSPPEYETFVLRANNKIFLSSGTGD
jgi:hypothetical protein